MSIVQTNVNIYNIYPSMEVFNKDFFGQVKQSLIDKGFINPLIVVPMDGHEWTTYSEDNPDMLKFPPLQNIDDVVLQIRCGNNRYWAARQLGFRTVPIIKCGSMKEASKMCKAQQKEMKQWQEAGEW